MQFTDFVADQLSEGRRYSDTDQQPVSNPGAIDEQAIDRIQEVLRQYTEDRSLIAQWFGSAMTQNQNILRESEDTIEQWSELVSEFGGCNLRVNEGSRVAFYQGPPFCGICRR